MLSPPPRPLSFILLLPDGQDYRLPEPEKSKIGHGKYALLRSTPPDLPFGLLGVGSVILKGGRVVPFAQPVCSLSLPLAANWG